MKVTTGLLDDSDGPYPDKAPFINGFDAGWHTMKHVIVQAWGNRAISV